MKEQIEKARYFISKGICEDYYRDVLETLLEMKKSHLSIVKG